MKRHLKMFRLFALSAIALLPGALFAQGVTTSSMAGNVTDTEGMAMVGATVVAVHQPSGTTYGTATDLTGAYRIPNMRVGGPYSVTVSYTGYGTIVVDELFLRLGETEYRNFVLDAATLELESITVTATSSSAGAASGASTQITNEVIQALPTLDGDIDDFLRLTPQAGLYGDGITFAGTNNRFNAIYIDGAVNNDVFGLASSGTNGGQTGISPFSIDIIDQLQVVLSPYDVTLGGFAGGGINAVTKSGTNTFTATAYTFLQNENLVGKTNGTYADRFDLEREKVAEFAQTKYGFSLGGPIRKDKAFFFANVEVQDDETPIPFELAEYTSVAGRASQADLTNLRNFLVSRYNYDPGSFGSTSDELQGLKFFGKVDVNLDENNRLTLRHQYTKAEQYNRNGGSSNRINFSNNGIYFPSTTNSTALELNSVFGTNASNNLILSYVTVVDDRDPIGSDFPYVYIRDAASGQITFGSEEFSTGNALDQKIFAITNNFNLYRGAHTITIGTHNEFYDIYNLFIPQNYGTYTFASLNDFLTEQAPINYVRAYSLVDDITGDGSAAAADFKAMQLGFYVQDEWVVNPSLTVTGGLRVDIPIITSDPADDGYFNSTALPKMQAAYDVAEGARAGAAPDGQLMISPRVGFTYDVKGDRSQILRGGMGVFTSRIPFVWPGAMYNNNGLTTGRVTQGDVAAGVTFRPGIDNQYVNPNFTVPSGQIDLFTKDFKYPQVFRTNLAYDFTLPFGIETSLEFLFTKTMNNILYTNINSDPTIGFNWTGADNRSIYTRSSIDRTYSAVYLASNTSEGYSVNMTASFAKRFDSGLYATLAYSFGDAYSVSEGTSSQNSSQWRGQLSVNGRNNPGYGRADFAVGNRVVSSLTYRKAWSKDGNNATTVALYANAQNGIPYSYVIAGGSARNLNNETGSTSRNRSLIYIPNSANDINLVDYTVGGTTVTAAQQWENLNRLINDDPYLKANRGGYADKNGSWAPFSTDFDFSLKHDFGVNAGGQNHRLQLSIDVINFANLLNKNWGVAYSVPGEFNYYYLYQFDGYEADGRTPKFSYRGDGDTGTDRFDISNSGSRWRMRVGLRYMFN